MTEALTHVYIFPNHMAICFDSEGNQAPALQGRFEDIKSFLIPAILYHKPSVEICCVEMKSAYEQAMKDYGPTGA